MIRVYIGIAALVASFIAGWVVNQYRSDSLLLAEERGAELVAKAERERESQISKDLEARLAAWDTKQWVVYREKTKIVDRPIYSNNCLDNDGVQLINDWKGGHSSQYDGAVSTSPRPAGN